MSDSPLTHAREALLAAELFISNGVELGYIRMPDADLNDSAHMTLPLIRKALALLADTRAATPSPHLKDGETPNECIERWRGDALATVELLRQERARTRLLQTALDATGGEVSLRLMLANAQTALADTRSATEGSEDRRQRAEALWEELGGDPCICQRADVLHWCEKCQQRIDLISSAFRLAASAPTRETGWQPIETAPKDGTPFLVCWAKHDPHQRVEMVGGWQEYAEVRSYGEPEAYGWHPLPNPLTEKCAVFLPSPPSAPTGETGQETTS